MTAAALECRGLTQDYGNGTVIGPLDMRLDPGVCLALVGPNGAGKTTFLHMILGLRRPTSGEARIHGIPASRPESRRGIGYLQEAVDFPEREKALSLLRLHCRLTGALGGGDPGRVAAYLESFGLELTGKPLRIYSKGMKQRLALALAMLDCGRMLVLDEPNSGLDPVGIAMLRHKLEEAKAAGATLLLSTHRLAEARLLADKVMVLNRGRIAGEAAMGEFQDYEALEKFFMGCVG